MTSRRRDEGCPNPKSTQNVATNASYFALNSKDGSDVSFMSYYIPGVIADHLPHKFRTSGRILDRNNGGRTGCDGNKEQTTLLIRLRGENDHLFTGVKNSATVAWRTILEKMGLQGTVTPLQARKKWDNLKTKYKDCKYPGSGEGVSGKPTAATWPWYALMDEVIGQRPSIRPPVLLSTLPEDTPGPSSAVATDNSKEGDRDDKLLNLIREDMQQQREAEERRAQESKERMDRLFSILERLIPK
ncbi:uncharacterized protein LOC118455725 [Neolamprologus brichardi]|uniref:uncharacterized protein LOC118455725 n=1 Tax=Neolamprologus brichardi TaxID=32507 RepID=UPI0016437C4F|nr:uncharacterized protein LOC118455725 [Neolamprologus brichardi]